MIVGETYELQFIAKESIYLSFLESYEDRNPLHTDVNFAENHGFDQVVLHGNILNGFISYFIGEALPIKNVMIISQSIDYHNPFFKDDILDFRADVKNVSMAVNTIEFKFVFQNLTLKKIAKGTVVIKIL